MLKSLDIDDELSRNPSLRPNEFTALKLHSVKPLGETLAEYTFSLPQATHFTGCFPGQYVLVRIGKHQRFLSPVSRAKELGKISLLLKHETNGIFSNCIRALQIGENNITKYLEVKCKPILWKFSEQHASWSSSYFNDEPSSHKTKTDIGFSFFIFQCIKFVGRIILTRVRRRLRVVVVFLKTLEEIFLNQINVVYQSFSPTIIIKPKVILFLSFIFTRKYRNRLKKYLESRFVSLTLWCQIAYLALFPASSLSLSLEKGRWFATKQYRLCRILFLSAMITAWVK